MKAINTWKIGTDPEFYAVDRAGLHVNVKAFTTKQAADVAWDHDGDVLEVKPKPSKFAFRIVRRIRKLLLEHEVSKKLLESYNFRGGVYIKTAKRSIGLGGHVHFDFPYTSSNWPADKRIKALGTITDVLETLDILPKQQSRYRHEYQVVDLVRKANDADRLEYRLMGSFLHSPIAAHLCLTAAKLAACNPETVNKIDSLNALQLWFEQFKNKDDDAARCIEKIFEPKLKLEARLDVNLQDSWKSLKKLGGLPDAVSAAL